MSRTERTSALRSAIALAVLFAFALASALSARPSHSVTGPRLLAAVAGARALTHALGNPVREFRAAKPNKSLSLVPGTKRRADRHVPSDGLDLARLDASANDVVGAALESGCVGDRHLRFSIRLNFAIDQHEARAPPSIV